MLWERLWRQAQSWEWEQREAAALGALGKALEAGTELGIGAEEAAAGAELHTRAHMRM